MTSTNTLKSANSAVPVGEPSHSARSRGTFPFKPIFFGSHGLRAGWRLVIFAVLIVVLVGAGLLIRNGGVQGFREAQRHQGQIPVTPSLMIVAEIVAFIGAFVATGIMSKIERRKFSVYGLPWRLALHKDFWIGTLCGFLALSGSLLTMFLFTDFASQGSHFRARRSSLPRQRGPSRSYWQD
jgi:uncharacterized protein